MSEYITFIAIALVMIVSLVIAAYIVIAYNQKEKLHQELSNHFGMRGSFVNDRKFKLFGYLKDYKLSIESVSLNAGSDSKKEGNSIKLSIPVVNPSGKCLRIYKEDASQPALGNIVPLDKLLDVQHDMGSLLQIHTNDLVFSSLVLSDNARISIHNAFKNQDHGAIMFIQGEELACVIPTLLKKKSQLTTLYTIADTLVDMKDELN